MRSRSKTTSLKAYTLLVLFAVLSAGCEQPSSLIALTDRTVGDASLDSASQEAAEDDAGPAPGTVEAMDPVPLAIKSRTVAKQFIANPEVVVMDKRYSRRVHDKDNLWLLAGAQLSAAGWREFPPPVKLKFPLENGRYMVAMRVESNQSKMGHPASAFLAKAEDDTEFFDIVEDSRPPVERGLYFVPFGRKEYTIRDGSFDVTLRPGTSYHWAIVREFRFLRLGAVDSPVEDAPPNSAPSAAGDSKIPPKKGAQEKG